MKMRSRNGFNQRKESSVSRQEPPPLARATPNAASLLPTPVPLPRRSRATSLAPPRMSSRSPPRSASARVSPRACPRDPLAARTASRRRARSARLACRASTSEAPRTGGSSSPAPSCASARACSWSTTDSDKLADPEGFAVRRRTVPRILPRRPAVVRDVDLLAAGAEPRAPRACASACGPGCARSLFSTMALAVCFHVAQSGLEGFPWASSRSISTRSSPPRLLPPLLLLSSTEGRQPDNALKKKCGGTRRRAHLRRGRTGRARDDHHETTISRPGSSKYAASRSFRGHYVFIPRRGSPV